MTGIAAVALSGLFSACNNVDDLSGNTAEFNIMKNYEEAFITRFGQPAANQTWGFGDPVASTRGHNANANEWADPDKAYGGWTVPDPLDEKQKLRVKAYFQYNQYPGGTQCDYKDFFVQQVYKGNPQTKGPYSDEQYQSANGSWVVGSDHMDHLTAGSIHDHINNFNYGDYSGGSTVTVLDNGQHVNGGSTHQDQIMLMVNSQTDCFGYWNSDGSLGHDDRYRLVSAQTIDDWIEEHADLGFGPNYGMKVVDDWNRSFIGFDFDQVAGDDVYVKANERVENGEKKYDIVCAKYSEGPAGNTQYMAVQTDKTDDFNLENPWGKDKGEKAEKDENGIIVYEGKKYGGISTWIGGDLSGYGKIVVEFAQPTTVQTQILIQRTDDSNPKDYSTQADAGVTKIVLDFNGKDMTNITNVALQPMGEPYEGGSTMLYIKKIYLLSAESFNSDQYIYYNNKQVPYLKSETNQYCGDFIQLPETEVKDVLNNQQCVNKAKIDEMVAAGYLPVSGSNLKDWVRVHGGADGYYSDWIVTICKAEKKGGETPTGFICRVIAEDLTVSENTDFDFNDVVFDVYANGVIRVRACGGTLPLRVDGQEVHGLFGKETGEMTNTGWDGAIDYYNTYRDIQYSGGNVADVAAANNILVEVQKQNQWIPLTAPVGEVASKIAVKNDYEWCSERQDIDSKWHLKDGTRTFSEYVRGNIPSDTWYRMVIEEAAKYQNKKTNK